MPLVLALGFDLPNPTSRSTSAKDRVPARVVNLADVDAFLRFALARKKVGTWDSMETKVARLDGGKGAWSVAVLLGVEPTLRSRW